MKKTGSINTMLLKTSDLFGTMHFKRSSAVRLQKISFKKTMNNLLGECMML